MKPIYKYNTAERKQWYSLYNQCRGHQAMLCDADDDRVLNGDKQCYVIRCMNNAGRLVDCWFNYFTDAEFLSIVLPVLICSGNFFWDFNARFTSNVNATCVAFGREFKKANKTYEYVSRVGEEAAKEKLISFLKAADLASAEWKRSDNRMVVIVRKADGISEDLYAKIRVDFSAKTLKPVIDFHDDIANTNTQKVLAEKRASHH